MLESESDAIPLFGWWSAIQPLQCGGGAVFEELIVLYGKTFLLRIDEELKCTVWIVFNPFANSSLHGIPIKILISIKEVVLMLKDTLEMTTAVGLIDAISSSSQASACICHKLQHTLTNVRVGCGRN